MEYLSKQRYDELAAELKQLIEVVYPKVTGAPNSRMAWDISVGTIGNRETI